MNDEQLIAGFESATLSSEQFSHAEHVRAAWWYLKTYTFPEALGRFCTAIQRFSAAKGKPERYHETITVAYMLLIAERLDDGRGLPWAEFAKCNTDLLAREPSLLARYYTAETLASDRARRVFVMPDRGVGGAHRTVDPRSAGPS
jgi:hypothetical protein